MRSKLTRSRKVSARACVCECCGGGGFFLGAREAHSHRGPSTKMKIDVTASAQHPPPLSLPPSLLPPTESLELLGRLRSNME